MNKVEREALSDEQLDGVSGGMFGKLFRFFAEAVMEGNRRHRRKCG